DLRRLGRLGLRPLPTDDALALFDTAVGSGAPLHAVTPLDTSALRRQADNGGLLPLLRELAPAARRRTAVAGSGTSEGPGLAERLAPLSAPDRERLLTDLVRAQVAGVLGHSDPGAVEPGRPFSELGFDSLTAVELRNQLKSATGLKLPSTLVFDYPNPRVLAGYLREQIVVEEVSAATPVLTGLDRIEKQIQAAVQADSDTAAQQIAGRLRELAGLAEEAAQRAAGDGGTSDEKDLDAASDEELFALIDQLD
ncbi:phosphopantetheine-binding protein, partial [Streptomyces sp. TRM 70351]|uniref:phosphopantetheine-binding protein n=1 Tax=Streptomyces sp. TRM 70351 TaxID=3116552 RepID=UPI002E7C1E78